MKIPILYPLEIYLKAKFNRLRINKSDFSIISNNCWGTFIYQKFGLPYQSPFQNLYLPAPDYIKLLEKFSPRILENLTFIEPEQSKYPKETAHLRSTGKMYPIGVLDTDIEIHFLHFPSREDALEKWHKRRQRINYDRLIFKYSDGEYCTDDLIQKFDSLPFKNKICFTAKPYENLKSVVHIEEFSHQGRVNDEWKHHPPGFSIIRYINALP